ncbi:hypothetical protein AOC36_02140 [Erysipelothrix larvae]|uniref:HTH araC/xylS-type domain-containing protein n=1 Tax=Erysipelothrix larvae TaxID=1514105 RepID=A0A0X8GYM2_9FIRM|nr:AraC family transcriptional regulator [Erysipelothrix larvae]AMC92826.1 hypothetical protein AOC36_02140 [Erysipelothrix larvae]
MTKDFSFDAILEELDKRHLKYNHSGEMVFDDDVYVSIWDISSGIFRYHVHYLNYESEHIEIEYKKIQTLLHDSLKWNQFGFTQDFKMFPNRTPYHKNRHTELNFVMRGSLDFKVQGEIVSVSEGDMLGINTMTYHSEHELVEPLYVVFIGFNDTKYVASILDYVENLQFRKFMNRSLSKSTMEAEYVLYHDIDKFDETKQLLELIIQEIDAKKPGYKSILRGLFIRFFTHMNSLHGKDTSQPAKGYRYLVFEEMSHYINEHYATISLQQLVDLYGYTKDYFNRLVKEMTGKTFIQYVQDIRLEKACEYLATTELRVVEIADKTGYSNISYFYKIFKNRKQITPDEYRKRYKI